MAAGLVAAARAPRRPTTFVITLKDGVTFWDGKPVTADDVVYQPAARRDPKLGGFYPQVFARVKSIKATGARDRHDEAQAARLLVRRRAVADGRRRPREGVRSRPTARSSAPSTAARCAPGRTRSTRGRPARAHASSRTTTTGTRPRPKVAKIDFKGVPGRAVADLGLPHRRARRLLPAGAGDARPAQGASNLKVGTEGPSFGDRRDRRSRASRACSATSGCARRCRMAIDRKALIDQLYKGGAQRAPRARRPGHLGLRAAASSRPTGSAARAGARRGKAQGAGQAGRRGGQDDAARQTREAEPVNPRPTRSQRPARRSA